MGPLKLKCAIILWICITFTCLINILLLKWVTWLLLVLLVVWDAVAVLTPCGPLRRIAMAVDTNAKNDALYSSLAYTVPTKPRRRQTKLSNSATLVSVSMSKEQNESTYDAPKPIEDMQSDHTSEMSVGTKSMSLTQMSKSENGRNKKPLQGSGVKSASLKPNQFVRTSEWIEEENAVGLGDLVFYAVLIQLVFESDSSWFVLIACILTILVGLYLTTCLMIITSKPLPALPLSIGVTMIVFNIIRYTRLTTLANQYTTAHTFV